MRNLSDHPHMPQPLRTVPLSAGAVHICLESILFGFPVPILFALFLNEVRSTRYKKAIQTASYLPHFISAVIICAMIREFAYDDFAETIKYSIIVVGTLPILASYPFLQKYFVKGVMIGAIKG